MAAPLEGAGRPGQASKVLEYYKLPVLVVVGATLPLAVGRQASVLDRLAPSMSKGIKRRPPSKVGGLCHEFGV